MNRYRVSPRAHGLEGYNGERTLCVSIINHSLYFSFSLSPSDPAAVDFEQYELSTLADTLKSYIQDLPCLLIPAVVYSELVYTAQGKLSSGAQHKTFKHHLFICLKSCNCFQVRKSRFADNLSESMN